MSVPETELPSICPKCGSKTMFGYGLAGGGMGPYVVCDGLLGVGGCDFFKKKVKPSEKESNT
jgi:hypothetical protein